MDDATTTIRRAGELLAGLAAVPPAALGDDGLCERTSELEAVGRLVDAMRVGAAAEIDARSSSRIDGLSDRYGFRTGAQFVEFLTRVSSAEASRRVRVGRATITGTSLVGIELPPAHPRVAEALHAGEIGVESAAAIVRSLDQAGPHATPEEIDVAEAELVASARHDSTDLVAVQARAWREALDPDGAEPRDERISRLRRFTIGRETEAGLTPFSGLADPVLAALLRSAINKANRTGVEPRFLSEADRQAGLTLVETADGTVVEGVTDPRTRDQRNYDVFHGLITAGLRATGTEKGEMRGLTRVIAVIAASDLHAGTGVGWLDDVAEPISAGHAAELACTGGLATIVMGENGEPLYLGKHKRYFSEAQMRALAVRDGGCVCAVELWKSRQRFRDPSADRACEGGNEQGGPTDIDNGVLLCPYHNHKLHRSGFQIRMIDARPHMLLTPAMDPAQRWRPVGKSRIEAVQLRRIRAG